MTDPGPPGLRTAIEDRLRQLSKSFVSRYGDDLSTLEVTVSGDRLAISGSVVVPKQLKALRKVFINWPPELFCCACTNEGTPPPQMDVAVLSELADDDRLLPGVVVEHTGNTGLLVYSRRVGGELISEWLPTDGPARLLDEVEAGDGESLGQVRSLLQLADGTVGWCALGDAERRDVASGDAPIVRALSAGSQRSVSPEQLEAVARAAEKMADEAFRYRLGGRDLSTGIDCSALVQHVLESQLGALLPRHTGDQMKVGRRVARPEIETGDLIFARTADRNIMHVGLVVTGERVIHACRLDGCVRSEPMASFLSRYRFLRAQRVLRRHEIDE